MRFHADSTKTVITKKTLPRDDSKESRASAIQMSLFDALVCAMLFTFLWITFDYVIGKTSASGAYLLAWVGFYSSTLAINLFRYRKGLIKTANRA